MTLYSFSVTKAFSYILGSILGPTFSYFVAEQFRMLKDGDRFFFTHTRGDYARGLPENLQVHLYPYCSCLNRVWVRKCLLYKLRVRQKLKKYANIVCSFFISDQMVHRLPITSKRYSTNLWYMDNITSDNNDFVNLIHFQRMIFERKLSDIICETTTITELQKYVFLRPNGDRNPVPVSPFKVLHLVPVCQRRLKVDYLLMCEFWLKKNPSFFWGGGDSCFLRKINLTSKLTRHTKVSKT